MIAAKLRAVFKPDLYHGWGRRRNFFEGWYFRIATADEKSLYAIIPGVSIDTGGARHSFIQVLTGMSLQSDYHRFKFEEFTSSSKEFDISIGTNRFSGSSMALDLPGLKGRLEFKGSVKWPSAWLSPGVMGPYSFVPLMECNHGIVSMYHTLEGELNIEGSKVDFTGGRAYTEKDWGRSFPEAYIWMQGNHFQLENTSFKISVARIPWLRNSFVGFISGFWFKGELIEFTTYNRSSLRHLHVSEQRVEIVLENRQYELSIACNRPEATALASPVLGDMSGHIHETMTALAELKLKNRADGTILFEGVSRNTALEVAGDSGLLMK